MSGNRSKLKEDARRRRTCNALGRAVFALIQEKPFDAITVQEILDRAGVGRSTFYTHFRDKEDLLLSDIDEFLEQAATALTRRKDPSDRVAPVHEFFAHATAMSPLRDALGASGKMHDFLDLAMGHFARGIERRLAELPRARGLPAERRAPLAHGLAGALLSMMTWWLDRGAPGTPAEMDAIYHQMVWAGVAAEDRPRKSG
jgi:AcrR family transcriptional regulator